jgi:hypothetical protein
VGCRLGDDTDDAYEVTYYFLEGAEEGSLRFFMKVDHEGRMRPEIFVLEGLAWRPATGLKPTVRGVEWDPRATPVSSTEAWRLLESSGLTTQEVMQIFASRAGRRSRPRPP